MIDYLAPPDDEDPTPTVPDSTATDAGNVNIENHSLPLFLDPFSLLFLAFLQTTLQISDTGTAESSSSTVHSCVCS